MIRFLICFVIVLQLIIFAQNTKVEVAENSVYVSLNDYHPKFKDRIEGNFIVRDYYEFTDPSSKNNYKLPFINIFLAIPPNSKITLTDLEFESKINEKTIPTLNPQAVYKDSVIDYIENDFFESPKMVKKEPVIQIESYFWLREFYIVHIRVNNFQFNVEQSEIEEISNINFRANIFPRYNILSHSPIKIKTDNDRAVKNLISNRDIAEQFRSNTTYALPDTGGTWINYDATYIKIGVDRDAVFRITKSNLENLGVNTNIIDPKTFKMFESGKQVKLFVEGENDDIFNDTDFIEFWGHKNYPNISYRIINAETEEYNEYLNRYTDTSFYFLTWDGDLGERSDTLGLNLEGISDTLDYHSQLLHFETQSYIQNNDNNEVANQTSNWNKNKTWYWDFLSSQRTFNFNLTDIYPGKNASVFAKLVSFASNYPTNSHQVKLSLNNVLIDSNSINRFEQLLLSGNINSSNLITGSNQILLENLANGSSVNSLTIDWYEIEYPRNLQLFNDSLYFTVPPDVNDGLRILKIGNANSPEYRIYKVQPGFKIISNYSVSGSILFFADTISAGDKYYIESSANISEPKFIYVKNFVNLRDYSQQTDYIAITHADFLVASQNYTQSITSLYNLSTSVFKVDDIFDEFSYGYPYPEGIRLFLNVLYNNLPMEKPVYLTLLGDANYDYKYFKGAYAGLNYVPGFGYPVSDNWYAIWDSNGPAIPQLKVGRIPFNNSEELEYYLSKIENNESMLFDEWNKRYILFSGGVSDTELQLLKSVNDTLVNRLISPRPISGKITHFYKTINPQSDFGPYTPEEIDRAISDGGVFISYIGHSGTATWDNSINETDQLYNDVNRNPIITDFGCSTNKYAEPDIICFGERFLFNSTGQALAYIGNSSLGFTSTVTKAPVYFYESLLSDSLSEIGNAHLLSKIKLYNQYGNSAVNKVYFYSNIILGDPAIRIKIPKLPNFKVSSSDLILPGQLLTDNLDSIKIKIAISNLGLATNEMLDLSFVHAFNSTELENELLTIPIPAFSDTVSFWISIKNKPGIHTININIDPDNLIDEIYEDDNSSDFQFNVFSNSIRDLLAFRIENPAVDTLKLLNPTTLNEEPFSIELQLDSEDMFSTPTTIVMEPDTFITNIALPDLQTGTRYYFRYKTSLPGGSFSPVKSFYNNLNDNFLLTDSLSFINQILDQLAWENDKIDIIPDTTNISVLSAGWYSGATCVIAKNGVNILNNTFFAGMGIAVFDNVTLEVDTVTWFQLFNQPANVEALANLIDSISPGKIVAMGVADDARNNLSSHLINAIKTLGSSKIDSLEFRGSWALIGWKGASTGSVIEEVKPALPPESISIDTSYVFQSSSGFFTTNEIGPASSWNEININENLPGDASIEYSVFGVRLNDQIDSLHVINLENGLADISDIDAMQYPRIIFKGTLRTSSDNMTPAISKVSVDFTGVPELGTNYQVVTSTADTLLMGGNIGLSFYVYNVGESTADSFDVKVEVINEDNSRNTIFTQLVETLEPDSRIMFELSHNILLGAGNKTFLINIDAENKITELFEDNNFYTVPFYVKPDTSTPTLEISFDGTDITDGDYVSANPEIRIKLNDESLLPVTDTSAITIYLNNNPVYYASNPSVLTINFDEQNPKAVVTYKPELDDGSYTMTVFGKNSLGTVVDSNGLERRFLVSSDIKLLNVYNYPNPTSGETYFTFKLTQIPDEIKIRIFTIAGRLIKEIETSSTNLNYDFNKIYWDGRDEDGDIVGNGVYLYKIILTAGEKTQDIIQKLAIVR